MAMCSVVLSFFAYKNKSLVFAYGIFKVKYRVLHSLLEACTVPSYTSSHIPPQSQATGIFPRLSRLT
jgi:hypothetical protein